MNQTKFEILLQRASHSNIPDLFRMAQVCEKLLEQRNDFLERYLSELQMSPSYDMEAWADKEIEELLK